jgi:hypothetical protein
MSHVSVYLETSNGSIFIPLLKARPNSLTTIVTVNPVTGAAQILVASAHSS